MLTYNYYLRNNIIPPSIHLSYSLKHIHRRTWSLVSFLRHFCTTAPLPAFFVSYVLLLFFKKIKFEMGTFFTNKYVLNKMSLSLCLYLRFIWCIITVPVLLVWAHFVIDIRKIQHCFLGFCYRTNGYCWKWNFPDRRRFFSKTNNHRSLIPFLVNIKYLVSA